MILWTWTGSSAQLSEYIQDVEGAIRDIREAYGELLNCFEQFIQRDIVIADVPFADYKALLQERYARLSQPMLMPAQRVFWQRLNSTTTDRGDGPRDAWLSALAQAILGKALDQSRDDDERLPHDCFRRMLSELDSLTNLSVGDVDPDRELAYGVEINSFGGKVQKKLIRVPKTREAELRAVADTITKQVLASTQDNESGKIVLAMALNELMSDTDTDTVTP